MKFSLATIFFAAGALAFNVARQNDVSTTTETVLSPTNSLTITSPTVTFPTVTVSSSSGSTETDSTTVTDSTTITTSSESADTTTTRTSTSTSTSLTTTDSSEVGAIATVAPGLLLAALAAAVLA